MIKYETHGNPNHSCIILITGIGSQLISWPKKLIDGLVSKKFYVVTFDNRDSGLSQYYDQSYTLEDMASDVILLMDKLSIQKAHILGVSMGGMIAQVFALTYPERVSSLILIATTSGDPHLPPAKPQVQEFFSAAISNQKPHEELNEYVNNRINLYRIYDPYCFNETKLRTMLEAIYKRAYRPDGFQRQILAVINATPRGERLKQLPALSDAIYSRIAKAKAITTCILSLHVQNNFKSLVG